jgi:deoxyribose-phosphate aldolase
MEVNKLIEEITREVLKELGDKGSAVSSKPVIDRPDLAAMMDHTILKPETMVKDIERVCNEAKEYHFASVCINPTHVKLAAKILQGTGVKVCTVIGFPLGANTPFVKAAEVRDAIANGAQEVDMVINIGALKDRNYDLVSQDIKAVVDAAKGQALVKVIIETSALTDEEKVKACLLAKNAGANFVKTSTGFGKGGATVEDITLMRKTVGPEMGVKASTGVKDRAITEALVKAGATRFGTSSGIVISTGQNPNQPSCVNCGNCSKGCPTGNAQVIKSNY